MKVVILAGGYGTRISEESHLKPKPMIEIGGKPILWHIMKLYSYYGFHDFIICLGYKGYAIKDFFAQYYLHGSDVTFDYTRFNEKTSHRIDVEPWKVTLVDTGAETMTGGRVKRIQPFLNSGEPFMLTYGDGLSDINLQSLLQFHLAHGRLATVSATQPSGRFGSLRLQGDEVRGFQEKPKGDGGWINAGYFVLEPEALDYIDGDATVLEKEPLERLAGDGQLMARKHDGFWQPMDTMRDKQLLEDMWKSGNALWKKW